MNARDQRLHQTVGGKYMIVKFLAEGGMGSVYEAQHLLVKRRFAVKFLRSDLVRRRDLLARFKLEAEAAGALESENVAAALDFGIAADGAPYIVMEYLDGVDLGRLSSACGPLPPERAADLVQQACAGTRRAHEAGILHRDLKPQNLFVCRRNDGTDLVKIVDFGVAKLQADEASSAVTRTGGLVGTPSYMSPEQARGEPEIDARTDVYALGVILYELLSGRTPHPGGSYNAVIHHIATQPALRLELGGYAVPAGLLELVQRAISPDARDRPASAAELERELSAFARRSVWPPFEGEAVSSTTGDVAAPTPTEGPPEANGSGQAVGAAPPRPGRGSAQPGQRRPTWLATAMLLVTAALLMATWSASREPAPPIAPSPVRSSPVAATVVEGVPTREGAAESTESRTSSVERVTLAALPLAAMPGLEPEASGPNVTAGAHAAAPRAEASALRSADVVMSASSHAGRPPPPPGRPSPRASAHAAATRTTTPRARFDPQNPYD